MWGLCRGYPVLLAVRVWFESWHLQPGKWWPLKPKSVVSSVECMMTKRGKGIFCLVALPIVWCWVLYYSVHFFMWLSFLVKLLVWFAWCPSTWTSQPLCSSMGYLKLTLLAVCAHILFKFSVLYCNMSRNIWESMGLWNTFPCTESSPTCFAA